MQDNTPPTLMEKTGLLAANIALFTALGFGGCLAINYL
jgi:hypothetical protein